MPKTSRTRNGTADETRDRALRPREQHAHARDRAPPRAPCRGRSGRGSRRRPRPSLANPSAPYWLMPTPWPQPRPLTKSVVALTTGGGSARSRGAGAPRRRRRGRPRARAAMSEESGSAASMGPGPEASEASASSRPSLPNLQLIPSRRFPRARHGQAGAVTETHPPAAIRDAERIARGGMGDDLPRARTASLGRTRRGQGARGALRRRRGIRRRFTREALAAARLSNTPNTVTIFDVGEHEGRPYIVMEYMPGGSLAERLARGGAQPPGRALAWLEQAAARPGRRPRARRSSTGTSSPATCCSTRTDRPGGRLRRSRARSGSTPSPPPAPCSGRPATSLPSRRAASRRRRRATATPSRVVAYELLTGSRPFERDSPTAEAAAHVNAPIPRPRSSNPDLPREVDACSRRASRRSPTRASRAPRISSPLCARRSTRLPAHTAISKTRAAVAVVATARSRDPAAPRPAWPRSLVAGVALAAAVTGDDGDAGDDRSCADDRAAEDDPRDRHGRGDDGRQDGDDRA